LLLLLSVAETQIYQELSSLKDLFIKFAALEPRVSKDFGKSSEKHEKIKIFLRILLDRHQGWA